MTASAEKSSFLFWKDNKEKFFEDVCVASAGISRANLMLLVDAATCSLKQENVFVRNLEKEEEKEASLGCGVYRVIFFNVPLVFIYIF